MSHVATIHFDAGVLRLPASDPYERELVFEQADFLARRHGAVRLQVDGGKIRAAHSPGRAGLRCASCHHPLRTVTFQVGERLFCVQCAKRDAGRSVLQTVGSPH